MSEIPSASIPSTSNLGGSSSSPSSTLPQDSGKLVLHHATGLRGNIRSNLEFVSIEDNEFGDDSDNSQQQVEYLAAPVGQHISFMHIEENCLTKTRFLPKKNSTLRECLAMAVGSVGPNKKYMALCERIIDITSEKDKERGGEPMSDGEDGGAIHESSSTFNDVASSSSHYPHEKVSQVISIYYLPNPMRKRAISCNHEQEKGNYTALAFTGDSKYLVGVTSRQVITIWLWRKETVLTRIQVEKQLIPLDASITSIKCAPVGSYTNSFLTQISTSGNGHLRLWPVPAEGVRDFKVEEIDAFHPRTDQIKENFIDHQWIKGPNHDRKLIALAETISNKYDTTSSELHSVITSNGSPTNVSTNLSTNSTSVGVRSNGCLKTTVYIFQSIEAAPYLQLKQKIEKNDLPFQTRLSSFLVHPKGILVLGSHGYVGIYDKTDDRKDPYVFLKTFIGTEDQVHSLCLSSNRDTIVAMTDQNRLLSLNLSTLDAIDDGAVCPFNEIIHGGYHSGSIVAMDVSTHKPLIATAGGDGSIRIWNYLSQRMEVTSRNLNAPGEEITALALHPDGFHILLGYRDSIKYYNILMDKKTKDNEERALHKCQEKSVKHCKKLRFSSSGHIFAAGLGLHVTIFNAVTFSVLANFPGHIGVIKDLVFSMRDTLLYTAGADGNIFSWKMSTLAKVEDLIGLESPTPYSSIDVQMNGSNGFNRIASCTDTDGQIRMFTWSSANNNHGQHSGGNNDKNISRTHEVDVIDINVSPTGSYVGIPEKDQIKPTYVCISSIYNLLIVGLSNGNIRAYPWPLQKENAGEDKNSYEELSLHTGPVLHLKFTADESRLISVGEDGSVFVIVMQMISGGIEQPIDYTALQDDISMINNGFYMIKAEDISDMEKELFELSKKFFDMKSHTEFVMLQKDNEKEKELKEFHEEHTSNMDQERKRYEELQSKYDKNMIHNMHESERKDVEFAREIRQLEDQYEHKLSNEMDRYDKVCEEITLLKEQYNAKLEEDKKKHAEVIKEMESKFNKTEMNLRHQIEKLMDESKHNDSTYREVLDQQEGEYEKEIKELISAAEKEIFMERDNTTKVRTAGNVVRTKLSRLHLDMENIEMQATEREKKLVEERSKNSKLEATLAHLENHLEERNNNLLEKERIIMDMRNNTRTLENFRYVLDHRLKQLMEERGPVTQHIEKLENHIRSMYDDLVDEFNKKKETAKVLEGKETKEKLLGNEVSLLRAQIKNKESLLDHMEHDIGTAVGLTNPKESVEAIKSLYRKYVRKEKQIAHGVSNTELISKAQKIANEYNQDSSNNKNRNLNISSGANNDKSNNKNNNGAEDTNNANAVKDAIKMDYIIAGLNESTRQREYMEKKTKDLQKINDEVNRESEKSRYRSIYENTELINQCNELRKVNYELKRDLGKFKGLCEVNGISLDNAAAPAPGININSAPSLLTASTSGSSASVTSETMNPEDGSFSPFQSNLQSVKTTATINTGKSSTSRQGKNKTVGKGTTSGSLQPPAGAGKLGGRGGSSSRRNRSGGKDTTIFDSEGRQVSRGSNRETNAVANLEGEILALTRDLDSSSREVSMYKIEVARLRRVIQDINNQKISSSTLIDDGMSGPGGINRNIVTRPTNKHMYNQLEGDPITTATTTVLPQAQNMYVSKRNNDLHDIGLIKKVSLQPRPLMKKV